MTYIADMPPTYIEEDEETSSITPVLLLESMELLLEMMTPDRLEALLLATGEISIKIMVDEETDEPVVCVGVPSGILEGSSDNLFEIVSLFRGLPDANYHPRMLSILKRHLN